LDRRNCARRRGNHFCVQYDPQFWTISLWGKGDPPCLLKPPVNKLTVQTPPDDKPCFQKYLRLGGGEDT
jgi:hypothetical protein